MVPEYAGPVNDAPTPLHDRLRQAVGGRTFRHVAELTGVNHESVRRYLSGQTPSVEFLAALCKALSVNSDWLLFGRGPMRLEDVRASALREAPAPDLLTALAGTVEELITRIERLERFLQTMEIRVRAEAAVPTMATRTRATPLNAHGQTSPPTQAAGLAEAPEPAAAVVVPGRIAKLVDGLLDAAVPAKRPPQAPD
jgi:transcriptional regulator with XRE-family HTH domain